MVRSKSCNEDTLFVFNAIAIKTGGGMQKTISLLDVLSKDAKAFTNCIWVVVDKSELALACDNYGFKILKVKSGRISRLKAEFLIPLTFPNKTVIFNLGGACMVGSIFTNINISECAYSNLFYPKINFWKYEAPINRFLKFTIDFFRILMISFSDEIVFQTEEIKSIALNAGLLPKRKLHVVSPAVSSVMNPKNIDNNYYETLRDNFNEKFTFLFACGDQRNKRIQNLPLIAHKMKFLCGKFDFLFVITLNEESNLKKEIIAESEMLGCRDNFKFIGQHAGSKYASLLSAVDSICNFAVLESFSNNFLEAWSFGKPLIAPKTSWARSAAGNSAYYVNPDDIDNCASSLVNFILEPELQSLLVNNGYKVLSKYPTPEYKAKQYLSLLNNSSEPRKFISKIITIKKWLSYYWFNNDKQHNV